jgi:hypothetical protein
MMDERDDPVRRNTHPPPESGYPPARFETVGFRRTRSGTYILWTSSVHGRQHLAIWREPKPRRRG